MPSDPPNKQTSQEDKTKKPNEPVPSGDDVNDDDDPTSSPDPILKP